MWFDILKDVLLPYAEFTGRLWAALLFGAMIGLERQKRQRRAGLRTNALVSLGSASFVSLSVMITDDASPTRIISQVVSGVGFLGAGAILRDGMNVRGLNTAATLWSAAAVGALSGTGFVVHSFITAALIVFTHVALRPMGYHIDLDKPQQKHEMDVAYRAEIVCHGGQEGFIRGLLLQTMGAGPLHLRRLRSYELIDDDTVEATYHHRLLAHKQQREHQQQEQPEHHQDDLQDDLQDDDTYEDYTPENDIRNTLMKVEAEFVTTRRQDKVLENLVSHLSLEPSVSEVSWCVIT
jgi:putative Mg2+ transporter-C (MgtC) family protein